MKSMVSSMVRSYGVMMGAKGEAGVRHGVLFSSMVRSYGVRLGLGME